MVKKPHFLKRVLSLGAAEPTYQLTISYDAENAAPLTPEQRQELERAMRSSLTQCLEDGDIIDLPRMPHPPLLLGQNPASYQCHAEISRPEECAERLQQALSSAISRLDWGDIEAIGITMCPIERQHAR